MDRQTLERKITRRLCSEVDNAEATIETRVHDATWTAMDSLVIPRGELIMKAVNGVFWAGSRGYGTWPRPQSYFREFLQMTASSRPNSEIDSRGIAETRINITMETNELSFNKKTLTGNHTVVTAAQIIFPCIRQPCNLCKHCKISMETKQIRFVATHVDSKLSK